MLHSAASDLGMHCLLMTLLHASQIQWVNAMQSSLFFAKIVRGHSGCIRKYFIRTSFSERIPQFFNQRVYYSVIFLHENLQMLW